MLRAIYFLDCDFCHESHSDIRSMTDRDDINWRFVEGDLLESAFADGWCHCLIEDTGMYKLMCCACHADRCIQAECDGNSEDSDF